MPVARHLSIWAIIFVAVAVFAVERVRNTDFAEGGGTIPRDTVAAVNAIGHGDLSLGVLKTLSNLVTALFLHGDVEHILFNMVFLWTFGVLTSELLGRWWALAVFLVCGVCGNLVQTYLNPASPVPTIGASGAICGFEGVYLGLALRWQLPWAEVWPLAHPVPPLQLGVFALVGFIGDMALLADHSAHIAYGAHVGGFLSGPGDRRGADDHVSDAHGLRTDAAEETQLNAVWCGTPRASGDGRGC